MAIFNYTNKKEEIEFLLSLGYSILEIKKNEDESIFYVADSFEPPIQGSVHSAPYVSLTGKDISKFLKDNIFNQGNIEQFKNKLNSFNNTNKSYQYKFSDSQVWTYYSA